MRRVISLEISVESHVYCSVVIGGRSVPLITDAVITMWVVTALIIFAVVFFTRKLDKIPKGLQNVAEMFVDFIQGLTKGQMHHHYKYFQSYIGALILFIAVMNCIALINIIPNGTLPNGHHFGVLLEPPTRNFNVPLCLALTTCFFMVYCEFRFKGFKGWLSGFYKPNPIFGFVKILDYIVRPMSLCLRLFGSILGGTVAMGLVYAAMQPVPILLPGVIGIYFDIFEGVLMAYVFVFLSTLYLAEAVELPEEVK